MATAGEKKTGALSNQVVGENLKEIVPLSFHLKDNGKEIHPAPRAYIHSKPMALRHAQ